MSEETTTFIPHLKPALQSGNYTIAVDQKIKVAEAAEEYHSRKYKLAVAGPRFGLPEGEQVACFPPNGREGMYERALPYIVLKSPTLPWQRLLGKGEPDAPWLAVLVFEERENPARKQVSLAGLWDSKEVFHPDQPKEEGEDREKDQVQIIDVPRALFLEVAPSLADIPWLAHVREVSRVAKALSIGRQLSSLASSSGLVGASDKERTAVVLSCRLPGSAPNTVIGNVAHLVSLEGFGPYLRGGGLEIPKETVRLVSLATWRFAVRSREYTLDEVIKKIDKGALRAPLDKLVGPAEPALSLGYVPVDHSTRKGDAIVSWYRGPLTPAPVAKNPKKPKSADHALRYDPEKTGMFDISYAAAWELGRLLMLQERSSAESMVALRRRFIRASRERIVQIKNCDHLGLSNSEVPLVESLIENLAHGLEKAFERLKSGLPPEAVPPPAPAGEATAMALAMQKVRDGFVRESLIDKELIPLLHGELTLALNAVLQSGEGTAAVEFLARLKNLHGVPFHYLVAHPSLLPESSVRRFYFDQSWVEHLMEGARSVGQDGEIEEVHDELLSDELHRLVELAAAGERDALLGLPPAAVGEASTEGLITGFLLRSSLLSDWPGLEVAGLDAAGKELHRRRLETLSASTLLGLFDGKLARLRFREPTEESWMGLDPEKGHKLTCRGPNGEKRPQDVITVTLVGRSLNIAALAQEIGEKIKPLKMTSAVLGLQLIQGAIEVEVVWKET